MGEGITVTLKFSKSSPIFCQDHIDMASDMTEVPLVDVTFVDDEAIMVTAASPETLNKHIARVVEVVYGGFKDHFMTVNFTKGKTEAMVVYRGKTSAACKSLLADSADVDGNMFQNISFVHRNKIVDIKLCIVDQYKHLGSIDTKDVNLVPEARARASSAMSAYAPIAMSFLERRQSNLCFGCN